MVETYFIVKLSFPCKNIRIIYFLHTFHSLYALHREMRQVYNKELQIRLAEAAGLLVRLKGVQFYCNLDHVITFLKSNTLFLLHVGCFFDYCAIN